MKNHYLVGFLGCFLFLGTPSKSEAQTALIPQSIITNLHPASPGLTNISNLSLSINSNTDGNSEFPFSPSSTFSNDIGFVSMAGENTGTITYTFSNLVTLSEMLIWNGYFEPEYEDNIKDFYMTFRDASGTSVYECFAGVWHADSSDGLKPRYLAFSTVNGVKSVDIQINTLWGGDKIALRRIVFMGTEHTANLTEYATNTIQVYPNPAVNQLSIHEKDIQTVQLVDLNGKSMEIEWIKMNGYSQVYWTNLAPGLYNLQVTNPQGLFYSKVLIE